MLKKLVLTSLVLASSIFAANEVNVYSTRHYDTDKKLFKMFEEKTGIKVNVLKAKAPALIKRIATEEENSPADLFITADAGNLFQAKNKGLLQTTDSAYLNKSIPANYRDTDKQWFALTKRARVTVVKIASTTDKEITSYEALANPKFKGQIVVRSSNNMYNQSLLAALIEHKGEAYALSWAKGVVANMARTPKGNDRAQVKAVANGIGKIAIANTYYIGKMVNNKDKSQREAVSKMKIVFPAFENGGTHVNISGAGITKYAPNKANAVRLLEFLVSADAQKLFAQANYEYPILAGIKPSALVASWGTFKEDNISLNALGKNNAKAVKIFDQAGWK